MADEYWQQELDDILASIKYDAQRLFEHPIYKVYAQAGAAYIKLKEADMWLSDISLPEPPQ